LITSTVFAGLTTTKVSPQDTPEKFYFFNESTKEYDVDKIQLITSEEELYKTRYKSKDGYQDLIKTEKNEFKLYENDSLKANARWLLYVGEKQSVIDYTITGKKQSIYINDNKDKKVCWEITFPIELEDDYYIPKEHRMETNGVIIDWTDFKGETETEVKDGKLLIWFYPKGSKLIDIDPTLTTSTETDYYQIISDDSTNKYQIRMCRTSTCLEFSGLAGVIGNIYSPLDSTTTRCGTVLGGVIRTTSTYGFDYDTDFTASLSIDTAEVAQTTQGSNVSTSAPAKLTDGTTNIEVDYVTTFFPTKVVVFAEVDFKDGITLSSSNYSIIGQGNQDAQGGVNFSSDYKSAISGTETSRNDASLTTNEDYAWTNSEVWDAVNGYLFDMLVVRNPLNNAVQVSGSGAESSNQRYEHSYINSQDAFWETMGTGVTVSGVVFATQEMIFEGQTSEATREAYAWDIRNPYAVAITGTLSTTADYVSNGYDVRYGWYEIAVSSNEAEIEFDDKRGGATSYIYNNTPIKITGYTDSANPVVSKSTDDGGSWVELTEDTDYIITDEADESEVGSDVRIFQLLGTMSGTGATANHLRFTGAAAAGRTRRIF